MKLEFSQQIFKKYSNIKFYGNPCSGSRVVSMRTNGQTDRQTDMTKLAVAFINFLKAPKNGNCLSHLPLAGQDKFRWQVAKTEYLTFNL